VLNAAAHDIIRFTCKCITLAKGKHEECLYDSMPKAVSQAMALNEVKKSVQFIHFDKMLT
jgi:hypothetical protein